MEEFLEYEPVMTLMTLTGVQRFGWDAMAGETQQRIEEDRDHGRT